MKFICIMGRNSSGKSTVEAHLEKMGFKRSISYTSRPPHIKNGKQEETGQEYIFVTRDKFMELVDKGKIIEYEEYNNNLYGTPRPYGATRYVAVVCVGGFKALKALYGKQVTGVYLKCDEDVALNRSLCRDGTEKIVTNRKTTDNNLLTEMESEADVVIDSNQDLNKMLADILKLIRSNNS